MPAERAKMIGLKELNLNCNISKFLILLEFYKFALNAAEKTQMKPATSI